ncbi:hypothetical protein KFE25_000273 [Diacronema lutheri]|uniref:tRNA/rRNA methyltransferase SpoU type domain-containing protein n=2 Tax=Diacronema lutheri TaxID=2081491 RepID=A0A8J6CBW5_DIALT|nr:hypothetical protein KFE25_000273 [Diacronema lutheri]
MAATVAWRLWWVGLSLLACTETGVRGAATRARVVRADLRRASAVMNIEKPSYRKVRDFLSRIDSAVIATDSTLAQQARNVFSKEDAYAFSREAYTGPVVLLVRPHLPQNIGSVARSMLNFGLTELRIVRPDDARWLCDDALATATGAREILENAVVYDDLRAAVADMHTVYATTARFRDTNKPEPLVPREAAEQIAASIGAGRKVGILFGSERNGLSNDEVDVAHELVCIPSNMMFGSLNLSHAVMVLAYECWLALLALSEKRAAQRARARPSARFDAIGQAVEDGRAAAEPATPQPPVTLEAMPATFSETEALFSRLRHGIEATGKFSPERAMSVYPKLHNMLLRLRPSGAEVRLLHGVVRAVFGRPSDTDTHADADGAEPASAGSDDPMEARG